MNAVTPGPIDTSITDKLDPEVREQFGSGIPLGRFGASRGGRPGDRVVGDAGFVVYDRRDLRRQRRRPHRLIVMPTSTCALYLPT